MSTKRLLSFAIAALALTAIAALAQFDTNTPGVIPIPGVNNTTNVSEPADLGQDRTGENHVLVDTNGVVTWPLNLTFNAVNSNAMTITTNTVVELVTTNSFVFRYAAPVPNAATFYNATNGTWHWNSTKNAYTNSGMSGYGMSKDSTIDPGIGWVVTNASHNDVGAMDFIVAGEHGIFTNSENFSWADESFTGLVLKSYWPSNTVARHRAVYFGDGSNLDIPPVSTNQWKWDSTNITTTIAADSPFASVRYWNFVSNIFSISGSGADQIKCVSPTFARFGTNLGIYYGSYSNGVGRLCAAFGNFQNGFVKAGAVLSPSSGQWDSGHIGGGRIYEENGTNFLFYFAGTNANESVPEMIGIAWTTNGTNFAKYSGNPILTLGGANTSDSTTLYTFSVIKHGSVYYGFYNASGSLGSGDIGGERIHMATASSLTGPWTKYSGNPIIDANNGLGGITSDISVYRITDNVWGALYWVNGQGNFQRLNSAYSTNLTNWIKTGHVVNRGNGATITNIVGPQVFYHNGLSALVSDEQTVSLLRHSPSGEAQAASSLNGSFWPGQDAVDKYWLNAVRPGEVTVADAFGYDAMYASWFASTFSIRSNHMLNWPVRPTSAGAAALVNSNGTLFILTSGLGNTWTATNKIAP